MAPSPLRSLLSRPLGTSRQLERGFRQSALALAFVDRAGRFTRVNPVLCTLLGRDAETLLATDVLALTHPDDLAMTQARLADAVAGVRVSFEKRFLLPDGAYLWVAVRATPLLDRRGRVAGFLSQFEDISARVAAEQRLRESERRFESAFADAGVATALLDLDGRIMKVNHALCELLGTDADQLVGRPGVAFRHPDEPAGAGALTVLKRGETSNYRRETRVVTAAGDHLHVIVHAALVRDGAGDPDFTIVQVQDVTDRAAAEAELRHRSLHDPLTRLPNRALLVDRLALALPRAGRDDRAVAVLYIDVDDFKDVNDSGGHDVGDQLLQAVAGRLQAALRAGDTLARFGGDEFVALCEGLDGADEALAVAERLLQACGAPVVLGGEAFRVSASVGVALAAAGEGEADPAAAAEALLRDADLAMYRAKGAGKGRIELFDCEMREVALRRAALTHDLDHAIERGELHLVFQPIVSLTDGHVYGAEALLRWTHPERGPIGPDEFIPLAERNGRIIEIGRWVLGEAARHAAGWPGLCVGVNVSRRQLGDPDLVGLVASALERHGVEPERFVVEVTESALVEDPERATQALDALHAMGVRLALDDFGTGQSSLGSVSEFRLNTLKLDRAFLTARRDEAQRWSIVRAVTEMGRALHLDVIAEGVETAEQRDALAALGCDFGQGYLFSRPVAPEAITSLLATGSPNTARALDSR